MNVKSTALRLISRALEGQRVTHRLTHDDASITLTIVADRVDGGTAEKSRAWSMVLLSQYASSLDVMLTRDVWSLVAEVRIAAGLA